MIRVALEFAPGPPILARRNHDTPACDVLIDGERGAWTVLAGDYNTGYQWRMDWSATIPGGAGQKITVLVEDIKGLVTSTTVTP